MIPTVLNIPTSWYEVGPINLEKKKLIDTLFVNQNSKFCNNRFAWF